MRIPENTLRILAPGAALLFALILPAGHARPGDELSPAVFMNDESRLKVRHFLACWVNDFRPLHKSNVGG